MAGEKQIHAGHRQRMHERVQKYGLESLAEHEMLEYLLYFTITRRDTNPIATLCWSASGTLPACWKRTRRSCAWWRGWARLRPGSSTCCPRSAPATTAA